MPLTLAALPRFVLFALAVFLATIATAGAESASAQQGSIDFEDCGNDWECGMLTVPVDYSDPGGETIEIAVARLPAEDEDDRIGILLNNPGGPGAGGIGFARGWARALDDDVRERFDIVAFDPRGTGESSPVDCDEHLVDAFGLDQSPDDEAEFDALVGVYEDYAAACRAKYGEVLDHLGTRNVARDMDSIRAALEEEQVNFVGYSYGTRIGAVYADMFPDRVRAFVLDGAIDNSLNNEDATRDQAAGFEFALQNFLADCAANDCALAEGGDPYEVIKGVLAAAEEEPIAARNAPRPARPGEVVLGMVVTLYDQRTWPVLESALESASEGDASLLVTLADTYLGLASTAVLNAVNCADSPGATDPIDTYAEYLEALPRYTDIAPTFGATVIVDVCQFWASGVEPIGTPSAEGAGPILVVGTTGDPATPYAWAEALADQLASGVLLRHEGEGHTVYASDRSDCVDDLVNTFLIDEEAPVSGTSCRGDDDPVAPSPPAGASPASPADGATPDGSGTPRPPGTGAGPDSGITSPQGISLAVAAAAVVAIAALAVVLWRRG